MTDKSPSAARLLREELGHPIVDVDGHILELTPVFVEYVRETVGDKAATALAKSHAYRRWTTPWGVGESVRREHWISQNNLWGWQTKNTLDRATATIPGLYASRMDDLGIDFSFLYPSAGLFMSSIPDRDLREEVIRAYNRWVLELCGPFSDRMTPVAIIAMDTPEEAVGQLEHAVGELGHKVVCVQGYVNRPIEKGGSRVDYFGIDSAYDYDPVWAKCAELRVAPTFHSGTGLRAGRSVTNYVYNHIGGIAQAQEGLAKSLFLSGVTRRFPSLNFGFLECGTAWICSLYSELVGHYEKRNIGAMEYVNPELLDVEAMMDYIGRYADSFTHDHMTEARSFYKQDFPKLPQRDDFWRVELSKAEDIADLFVERFYVGCEADDRSVAWAFDTNVNPFQARIKAMFGSDIGHWDVTDVGGIILEAHELVEHGLVSLDDFREFLFVNPVTLHGRVNPDFFRGTRIENEASAVLQAYAPVI